MDNKIVLKVIEKNTSFGEISFISGNRRSNSAVANDFCRVYKIKRVDFQNIIQNNDEDFENFQMLKEQIILNESYYLAKIKCFSCGKGTHLIKYCPKVHLMLSRYIIVQKTNYSL